MFNETCGPGQVQDYDPEKRVFLPGCVDDTEAYRAGGFPVGPAPPPPTGLFAEGAGTWLLIAAGAIVVFAVIGRGR